MDIRQLKYFIAAAEEGHLGRAAERLSLSQPALTRQIQVMEESVGAELFVRTPRGVMLTQVGQTLLTGARNVDHLLDQTLELVRRAGRGVVGKLDIGAVGTSHFDYVPRLLASLRHGHPEVGVTLLNAPTEQMVTALRQGRVLAMFDRRILYEPDLVSTVAMREPAVAALNEHHPLAQKPQIDIMELQNEPLFIARELGRQRGSIEFCREHGFEPRVVCETTDMTTGAVLVASGNGSAIFPHCLVNLRLPGIVYRPLVSRSDTSFELHCYYIKGERSPLLGLVLKAMQALAAKG